MLATKSAGATRLPGTGFLDKISNIFHTAHLCANAATMHKAECAHLFCADVLLSNPTTLSEDNKTLLNCSENSEIDIIQKTSSSAPLAARGEQGFGQVEPSSWGWWNPRALLAR